MTSGDGLNKKYRPRHLTLALILALFSGTVMASYAHAQFSWRYWNERFVIYDGDYPEMIDSREVRQIIADHGYRMRGRLRRNGRVYIADVRDRRGRSARLIIDGIHGDIVQKFDGGTRRSATLPKARNPVVRLKQRSRSTQKTPGRPTPAIASRPLPSAAPPIVPQSSPAPARQKPATVKVPEQPAIIPAPAEAAPVTIREIRKQASQQPSAPAAPRVVGPPVLPPVSANPPANTKQGASAVKEGSRSGIKSGGSTSTYAKATVAPLDDPGKRRDIAKPVPVAPLQ